MTTELKQAIDLFCQFIPYNKIGAYSPQCLDDVRLKAILDTAMKMNEEVRPTDIFKSLKSLYPELDESVIGECADTAFKHMLDL